MSKTLVFSRFTCQFSSRVNHLHPLTKLHACDPLPTILNWNVATIKLIWNLLKSLTRLFCYPRHNSVHQGSVPTRNLGRCSNQLIWFPPIKFAPSRLHQGCPSSCRTAWHCRAPGRPPGGTSGSSSSTRGCLTSIWNYHVSCLTSICNHHVSCLTSICNHHFLLLDLTWPRQLCLQTEWDLTLSQGPF